MKAPGDRSAGVSLVDVDAEAAGQAPLASAESASSLTTQGASTTALPLGTARKRLHAMDLFRGLIIAVMAWDHLREMSGKGFDRNNEFWSGPVADYRDNVGVWFARIITTLCAPGFQLLMGVGMSLLAKSRERRGWPVKRIIRHFVTRGLVLMAAERSLNILALSLASIAEPQRPVTVFVGACWVLNCLGLSMIIMGALIVPCMILVRRSTQSVAAEHAVALFAVGVNFLVSGILIPAAQDPENPEASLPWPRLEAIPSNPWQVFLRFFVYPGSLADDGLSMCLYNVIPWMGMGCLGLSYGLLVGSSPATAQRAAGVGAVAFLLSFFIVRLVGGPFFNFIGGPRQEGSMVAFIAFFTLCKYPPSIAYALFTLGVDLAILYLFGTALCHEVVHRSMQLPAQQRRRSCPGLMFDVLITFGHVPFFFFMVHLLLTGLLSAVAHLVFGGLPLLGIVPEWMLLLALMYPLCRRYDQFKSSTSEDSLWRLF